MQRAHAFLGLLVLSLVPACDRDVESFDPCPSPAHVLFENSPGTNGVVAVGDRVYVSSGQALYAIDPHTHASTSVAVVDAVALATSGGTILALTKEGELDRIDPIAGSVSPVSDVDATAPLDGLVASDDAVYVSGAGGVFRVTLGTGAVDRVEMSTRLDGIDSLALDGDGTLYVYGFVEGEVGLEAQVVVVDASGAETVVAGGAYGQETFYPSPGAPHVAVDDEWIYWVLRDPSGTIMRASKSGRQPEVLGTGARYVRGMAIRHGVVFTVGDYGLQRTERAGDFVSTISSEPIVSSVVATNEGLVFGSGDDVFAVCGP